jgi:hypothetical protein
MVGHGWLWFAGPGRTVPVTEPAMSNDKIAPIHWLWMAPVVLVGWALRLVVFLFDCALGLVCLPFVGLALLVSRRGPSASSSASPSTPDRP